MERSAEFNNAGVDCFKAGEYRMAWDLFKGALEYKLLRDNTTRLPQDTTTSSHHVESNAYIERAESHLFLMRSKLGSQKYLDPFGQCMCTRNRQSYDNSLYSPFLFASPIKLGSSQDMTSRKESATIIFNLAIIEHLKNRDSEQAVALYELAMTLLTGDAVDFLGLALMNNIGVWCYENNDQDSALTCMGHVANFVVSCESIVDEEAMDGLQANILWLLTNPQYTASPAA